MRRLGRAILALFGIGFGCAAWIYLTLPDVRTLVAYMTAGSERAISTPVRRSAVSWRCAGSNDFPPSCDATM